MDTNLPLLDLSVMEPTQQLDVLSTTTSSPENVSLTPFAIASATLIVTALILNFLLNPLMLFTLHRVTSIQPTTKIFMASLTMSDFLTGLFWVIKLPELLTGKWLLGEFLCAAYGVIVYTVIGLVFFSLLLQTVDRYIAIYCPLHYPTMMTVFRSKLIVCVTWVITIAGCILLFGIYDYSSVQQSSPHLCLASTNDLGGYISLLVIVLVFITISALYGHVSLIAHRQARRIAAENQAGIVQGGPRISTRSTTTIIIITGLIFIAWIPSLIRLAILTPQTDFPVYDAYLAENFTDAILLINSWLDVVIYYLRNNDLRKALKRLLADWFRCMLP